MLDQCLFSQVRRAESRKIAAISQFLRENDLGIDTTVDVFITVTCNDRIVACGGIAGNIIKCVAISAAFRGEGLALKLATELINLAYERRCTHLFIYTKSQNEALFKQCGFFTIASVPNIIVLMENDATRLQRYASYLTTLRRGAGHKTGCIVMNANPFTLGHRYLIQQAAAACDWLHVFLVKEDTSRFPYADRLALVQEGTKNIERVTVHCGSEYIISRATFPCYFIKEQSVIDNCYTEIDLQIFRRYLAPALGVTHRFVGSEPFCKVTAEYNHEMRHFLSNPQFDAPPIELVEIPRIEQGGSAISASRVRHLLAKKDIETIRQMVPQTTLAYLQKMITQDRPQHAIATGEK